MEHLKFTIRTQEEVDSTQAYIQREFPGNTDPVCVRADFQTHGKGQSTNVWHSEKSLNLLFSVKFCPLNLKADKSFYLSKVAALAVNGVLNEYLKDCMIKWPNDIICNSRKIAGILIDNTISGPHIIRTVIGFGVNVNQTEFPSFDPSPEAISIKNETGENLSLPNLLEKILSRLSCLIDDLESGLFDYLDKQYYGYLLNFMKWSVYSARGKSFRAQIIHVEEDGQLVLQKEDGKKEKFGFGEVSLVSL